jgi:hypothetical protein
VFCFRLWICRVRKFRTDSDPYPDRSTNKQKIYSIVTSNILFSLNTDVIMPTVSKMKKKIKIFFVNTLKDSRIIEDVQV